MHRKLAFLIVCSIAVLAMASRPLLGQVPGLGPGRGPQGGPWPSFRRGPGDPVEAIGCLHHPMVKEGYYAQSTFADVRPILGSSGPTTVESTGAETVYQSASGQWRADKTFQFMGKTRHVTCIYDPLAGKAYSLNDDSLTGRVFTIRPPSPNKGRGPLGNRGGPPPQWRNGGNANGGQNGPGNRPNLNVTVTTLTTPPSGIPSCPSGSLQGREITRKVPDGMIDTVAWSCPGFGGIRLYSQTTDPRGKMTMIVTNLQPGDQPASDFDPSAIGNFKITSGDRRGGRPHPGSPEQQQ
jgi:hypothetical protein